MVKQTIIELLQSTKLEGIDKLIKTMEDGGFFTAPCSGAYHLCKEGGLAEHSLNVFRVLLDLDKTLKADLDYSTMVIVGLLHDLGKMGDYDKPNYVPNYVRSKTKNKETGEYDLVISSAKPYETNKELLYIPHEVRSVQIIERCNVPLTEEEAHAIYYHNGKYTHIGYDLKETPLQMLLHTADMWVSREIEKEA